MKKRIIYFFAPFICGFFPLTGCQTMTQPSQGEVKKPPEITDNMDLSDALQAGVDFGGPVLEKVKARVVRKNERPEATKLLVQEINGGIISLSNDGLTNAVHLYQAFAKESDTGVLEKLIRSGRPLARDLGWNIASNFPSKQMAAAIDHELTLYIEAGDEKEILSAQLANAIKANDLKEEYTVLREGLMVKGDDAFAKAMIALNPARSSDDFLNYLALASAEELRQMNQKAVNMYTCMVILRHLVRYPVALSHPNFGHLFLYSISRNQGLAELANLVLETNLPKYKKNMALILSRQPAWVQVAYIESAGQNMTTPVVGMLTELKSLTPHREVLEELGELKL